MIKILLIILIIEILLLGILADMKINKMYERFVCDTREVLLEHEARRHTTHEIIKVMPDNPDIVIDSYSPMSDSFDPIYEMDRK